MARAGELAIDRRAALARRVDDDAGGSPFAWVDQARDGGPERLGHGQLLLELVVVLLRDEPR